MASRVLTITGLPELARALETAPAVANDRAAQAVAASTFSTERAVRSFAPEDTGTLKRAVAASATKLSGRVTIGPEAYYWRFIEFGYTKSTSGLGGRFQVPARPFVRTAAEQETPVFVRRLEDVAESIARDFASSRFL